DAQIPLVFVLVRGQLQLALVDMTNDSPTRRVDLADRLGLVGSRRRIFVDRGTLLVDGGHADDAHVEPGRALLDRLPAPKDRGAPLAFGEEKASLSAKGVVLAVKTPIEGMGTPAASPFGDEVEPTTIDSATLDLARDLADLAVVRALDNRADLRVIAGRD